MAGGFLNNTRRKIVQLPTMSAPTGGGVVQTTLPKTGLLSKIYLAISVTIAGSLSSPNALGVASAIPRIRLTLNSGLDLYNTSMVGYSYLLNELLGLETGLPSNNQGRTAVTATTFALDMVIPVAMNDRDPIGYLMLQNEQTIANLSLEFAAGATVATGATVTATIKPYLELFTVPVDMRDWPPLNAAHQILEDSQAVPAAGQFVYNWPRGNTYLQVAHGLGVGASGSDLFTQAAIRVNQSDYLQQTDTGFLTSEHWWLRNRTRPAGGIYFDLMGTTGLGNFGSTRDMFNSALVTDLATVITASNSGTLYSVRRQIVAMS